MEDDWDDNAPVISPSVIESTCESDDGKSFGKGRGYAKTDSFDSASFDSGISTGWQGGRGGRGGGRGNRGNRYGDRGGGHGGFQTYSDKGDKDTQRYGDNNGDGDNNSHGYKPLGESGFRQDNDENGGDRKYGGGNYEDNEFGGGYRPRNNRGGGRGGKRGGRGGFNYNADDERSNRGGRKYGGDCDDNEDGGYQSKGGYRSRDGGSGRRDNECTKNENETVKPPVNYIPPELSDNKEDIYSHVTTVINFNKYDEIPVKVSGENVPPPIESFDQAHIGPLIRENIKLSNYIKPTPVQKYALPIIAAGRDLMACAQTGSGKTAAYLIPIMTKLLDDQVQRETSKCAPNVLILAPTRELVRQIWKECHKFGHGSTLKYSVVYGGTKVDYQASNIADGSHILVATNGRLMDFVDHGRITFDKIQYIILDEADRMLDLGFMPDVERIFNHESMVPSEEKTVLMFSATFPEGIQNLAQKYLRDYLFLAVGIVGGACLDVKQNFYEVKHHEKKDKLVELLTNERIDENNKVIVFVETQRNVDFMASFLCERGLMSISMHGARDQKQREEALAFFIEGRTPILVATDIAGRGLDIHNVTHVINFDLPKNIETYTHRIGRTGRVGNVGKATSFYDPKQDYNLKKELALVVKQTGQEVPDWMNTEDDSYAPGRSQFGGEDLRQYGNENKFNTMIPTIEPEEEW